MHPWLKPLHRRIALALFLLAWLGWEWWYAGFGPWFWIVLALLLFALWHYPPFDRSGEDRGGRLPSGSKPAKEQPRPGERGRP